MVKRFCWFFTRDRRESRARLRYIVRCALLDDRSRWCRESCCRKRRGRFTVTGTPIQDDTIRKQEGTNEAERFTYRGSAVRICAKCITVKVIVKKKFVSNLFYVKFNFNFNYNLVYNMFNFNHVFQTVDIYEAESLCELLFHA